MLLHTCLWTSLIKKNPQLRFPQVTLDCVNSTAKANVYTDCWSMSHLVLQTPAILQLSHEKTCRLSLSVNSLPDCEVAIVLGGEQGGSETTFRMSSYTLWVLLSWQLRRAFQTVIRRFLHRLTNPKVLRMHASQAYKANEKLTTPCCFCFLVWREIYTHQWRLGEVKKW